MGGCPPVSLLSRLQINGNACDRAAEVEKIAKQTQGEVQSEGRRDEDEQEEAEEDFVADDKYQKSVIKSMSVGRAEWPENGITTSHMYAVLGLVILMGIQSFSTIKSHWDKRPMYNFPHVRQCMPRIFFLLLYCRFINMASKLIPGRDKKEFNALHQIR